MPGDHDVQPVSARPRQTLYPTDGILQTPSVNVNASMTESRQNSGVFAGWPTLIPTAVPVCPLTLNRECAELLSGPQM